MRFLIAVLVLGLSASFAEAQTWTEQGDAGDVWGTIDGGLGGTPIAGTPAQVTVGTGALTSIVGSVDTTVDDEADLYEIVITDVAAFSAVSTGSDTVLWLFDLAGIPILAQDDNPAGGLGSYLSDPSTFPGDRQCVRCGRCSDSRELSLRVSYGWRPCGCSRGCHN